MKTSFLLPAVLVLICAAGAASALPNYVELPPNATRQVTTAGAAGLPASFGGADQYYAVFRLGPLVPGRRYEATLTYDAGSDIGYGMSWVDGDPAGPDWWSFTGIGSGTGTRELKGKQEKYLFTVDPKSTSSLLYLVVRSHRPWTLSFALTDRPSGASPQSQDRWGYFYVTDFDADRTAPFLLTRGPAAASPSAPAPSGYVEVAPGQKKTGGTASTPWMPRFFGGPDYTYAVFRLGPLVPGRRYEATLIFDAGTNISYATSWLDGDPAGSEYWSFLGTGTGTGTREMKGKEQKFLFTVDAKSTAGAMYVVLRADQPWNVAFALTDQLSGATPNTQDRWGYYYVTDFDLDRSAPFLLTRGPAR